MTSTPSLPAQIGALREPGWYWVRVFEGAPWHPYHWYHSRDGEAFWIGRAVDDEPMAEIGPRIPDPVTLQQHERATVEVEWLRRLLRWCRPRLKHASYRTWLDMYLALGASPAPADEPPIVQSQDEKTPLR